MRYLKNFKQMNEGNIGGASGFTSIPDDIQQKSKQFVKDMMAQCSREKSEGSKHFTKKDFGGKETWIDIPDGCAAYIGREGSILFSDDIESLEKYSQGESTLRISDEAVSIWNEFLNENGIDRKLGQMYAGYFRELCADALQAIHNRRVDNVVYGIKTK